MGSIFQMANGGMHGILFYPFEWCMMFVIIFEHIDLEKDLICSPLDQ
jgi:hypothetical protein